MKLPLQVTFRNMESSEFVEAKVRECAAKLDRFCETIMACRVVVETNHRHHNKGNLYHVRIDITVPDGEIVVSREPKEHQAHQDAYVAVRDAFDAARRQLEQYVEKRKRHVKVHEEAPHGRVSELVTEQDYGRISTIDGRDIYFHRNSVLNADFDKLAVGTAVSFNEEMGDMGPQASTVRVVSQLAASE